MDDDEYDDFEDALYINFKQKFRAIRVIDNECFITNWTLRANVSGSLETDIDNYQLNLATLKIKFWFENFVNDSIVFAKGNEWAENAFLSDGQPSTETNVVLAHMEPTDDKLALLFQSKMNALANGDIIFSGIELESDNARGLSFVYMGETQAHLPEAEDWMEPNALVLPWWERDDSSTFDSTADEPTYANSLDFLKEAIMTPVPIPTHNSKIIKAKFTPQVIEGSKRDDDKSD